MFLDTPFAVITEMLVHKNKLTSLLLTIDTILYIVKPFKCLLVSGISKTRIQLSGNEAISTND